MPRSSPSTGSATLRMEKSSATMNCAAHSTIRIILSRVVIRGSAGAGAAAAEVRGGVSIAMPQPSGARNNGGESALMVVAAPPGKGES